MTPFPFIVGRGRSGTTLLRAMFDSHPEMAVPPESHVLVRLGRNREKYERDGRFDVEHFTLSTRKIWLTKWGLTPDELQGALSSAAPTTVPDATRAIFVAYAARHGKSRYAEKTPVNVLHIPLLATMFPESRFIHIVRDGRDVALSYMGVDFGPGSVGEAAIRWKRAVERGRRDGDSLGRARYREVKYESLVSDPEATVRELCEFVDLRFDPAVLRYFDRTQGLGRSIHGTAHRRLSEPPSKSRDWRDEMEHRALAEFEAIAGATLERFGYERGLRRIPVAARIGAGRSYCSITLSRARRHTSKRLRKIKKRWA